jgi:DNA-binding IclR family transcriptional regulator
VGRAAALSFSPLQVAKPELRRLADAYDVVCSAVFREGHDVVIRERAASVSTLGSSISAGTRLPLRPPFGGIFLAWSSEAEIAEWLDTLAPPATVELRAQMHRGIAFARENGFQCVVRTGQVTGGDKSTDWLFFDRPDEYPVSVLDSLDPAAVYPLAAVAVPVFDERREVAFVLTLTGFAGTRRGAEVLEAGAALQAVCARISVFIAGKG